MSEWKQKRTGWTEKEVNSNVIQSPPPIHVQINS
jgi:hypothetical protein